MTDHRKIAADLRQRAEESFQRCDTDGFLSQWADNINAQKHDLQAKIDENGGMLEVPALFDSNGNRVPARLVYIYNQFTRQKTATWAIHNDNDRTTWVPAFKKGKNSKLAKLGMVEGTEMAPCVAIIDGEGTGLSGRAWVSYCRTDGGWPGAKKGDK